MKLFIFLTHFQSVTKVYFIKKKRTYKDLIGNFLMYECYDTSQHINTVSCYFFKEVSHVKMVNLLSKLYPSTEEEDTLF